MKLFCEKTVLPGALAGSYSIEPCLVEIRGSQISSVGRSFSDAIPADAEILRDKLLSPAFVDAHTHLAMSFFRGFAGVFESAKGNMVEDLFYRLETHLTAADVRAFTRMGAYEAMSFGVGFVWDHYFYGNAIAQGFADVGFTGAIAPTLQDLSGPGKASWESEWEATETLANDSTMQKQGIVACWGPHATDTVSEQLWRKVLDAASRANLPIHAHLAQSREEYVRALEHHRCTPTQFLTKQGVLELKSSKLFAHAIYLDAQDLSVLAHAPDANLVWCPFAAMIFDFPANVMAWEQAGIPWLVGTDSVAANDSRNLQKELRYVSGFPLQQMSSSVAYTRLNGKASVAKIAAGREELWQVSKNFRESDFLLSRILGGSIRHPHVKVGSIEPGALANLAVWDLQHPGMWPGEDLRALCFGDPTPALDKLMVAGQWKGDMPLYEQHRQEAASRFAELKKRCGI